MKSGDLHRMIVRREEIKVRLKAGDHACELWSLERQELLQELVNLGGEKPGVLRGQVTRGMQAEMRQLSANGATLADLSTMFGYSRTACCQIKNGTYACIRED